MAAFKKRDIHRIVCVITYKQTAGKSTLCHWTLIFKYVCHILYYI